MELTTRKIMSSRRLRHSLAVTLAATMGAAVVLPAAQGGDWERKGSYAHGRGGTGTFQHRIQREPGQYRRSSAWENERGRGSAEVKRRWDREAGTAETKRSVTRPDGKAARWHRSSKRNADGGLTQQGRGTDFRGRDITMDRHLQKNGEGTWKSRTTYGREDGRSVTTEQTIERSGKGFTRSGTYATGDGRSGTVRGSTSRTDTGWNRQQTYTNQHGKTLDRVVNYERTEDGGRRTVTVTGPDGKTHERVGSFSFDADQPAD